MANNPEETGASPKDITPNPMEEAEKKAEAAAGEGAAAAAPAEAAADTTQEPPEDPGPQNVKDLLKESIIDSKTWNRIFQLVLLVSGLYGIYLSVAGQEFIPLPAVLGSFAFAMTALLDIYIIKKFRKTFDKLEITARIALAILFGLMTITFIVELWENLRFSLTINKNIMLGSLAAVVAVFSINFFLYISKNREKLLADVYMFIAAIAGFSALIAFYWYYVIISFGLAGLSMIALIASLSNDPLKNDDRFKTRLLVMSLTALMFLAIFAYAAVLFVIKPLPVLTYGPVTDSYKQRPVNLGWSGDSWSFDYSVFDKKRKEGKVGIINALSLGITELPPKEKADIKLPRYADAGVWNKNGGSLILTAGSEENGPRNIWAVALNLSLVDLEKEKSKKEKAEKEKAEKEKETLLGEIRSEIKSEAEKITGKEEKPEIKLRTKEDDRLNKPVGKPKVLLADMNLIVDKLCKPITHRTAWSPDGRRFCFAAKDDNSDDYNIWSADVKSQEIMKLTRGKNKVMPLWSPSGEKILWCSKTDSYTYLKISDYNGKNARELSVNRKKDRDLFPLWNKGESKVIYVKNNKFIVMNANATNQQELSRSTFPVSDYWLTDSKKKVKLEFTESGIIWRVWTMNTDGGKVKEIFTENCEELTQPKWSYDGKSIALGANYEDKTSAVFRLDKDGKMRTRLYTTKAHVAELEWANSSERLAFLAKREEEKHEEASEELWIIENDGTEPRAIYETKGKINNISWNDLGNRIAFDETINRPYFAAPITTVKVAEARGEEEVFDLLPYEFNGQYPTWSSDGQVLAYVSWNKYWTPGIGFGIGYGLGDRIWAAKLE